MTWIEHVASPLPRECSTTELHGRNLRLYYTGAGEGNRTLVISLEGFCSTIELHPPDHQPLDTDSQHTRPYCNQLVEGEGFEPSKAVPTDLQSVPFDRSGTPPTKAEIMVKLKEQVKTFVKIFLTPFKLSKPTTNSARPQPPHLATIHTPSLITHIYVSFFYTCTHTSPGTLLLSNLTCYSKRIFPTRHEIC